MSNGDADVKGSAAAEVHSTRNFKIPAFWRSNPELWFRQIESQFYTSRITSDSTKYHHVVAAMESEVLQHVSDIIISPPTSDMYEVLLVNLACMVDKIMEVAGGGKDNFGCIASTDRSRTRSSPSTNTDSSFEKLEKQIAALTLKVENLTKNRERSRSRNTHRSVSGTSRTRNGDKVNHELCWYHFKFGDKATKCREPCKFESSSEN